MMIIKNNVMRAGRPDGDLQEHGGDERGTVEGTVVCIDYRLLIYLINGTIFGHCWYGSL